MNVKAVLLRLAGSGRAWGGSAENIGGLFSGVAVGLEMAAAKLNALAGQASPFRADDALLERFEAEYGLRAGILNRAERWEAVQAEYLAQSSNTAAGLEQILQASGFDVEVIENFPVQDLYEEIAGNMWRWGFATKWGQGARWGESRGQALLLGSGIVSVPQHRRWGTGLVYGNGQMWFAVTGVKLEDTVNTPKDLAAWGMVFSVWEKGGGVLSCPAEKRERLLDLILKYKPLQSAALVYVS